LIDKFAQLVSALQADDVRFVVIGVSGANYWARHAGMQFSTKDRDLFLPPDPDNELRAWRVCERNGLTLWCGDEPLGGPKDDFLANAVVERRMLVTAIGTPDLVVDLSLVMAGLDFDEVWANHRDFEVDGVTIPVASLRDIIESKRIANREKDRLFLATHAEALRQFFGDE
jgi:hypothetical protein